MRGSGGDLSTSLCVLYFMWCVCGGGRGQLTGSLLPLWVLGIRLGSSGGSVSASTTEPPRWPGLCVLYSPNVEELQRVKGICLGKMSTRVIWKSQDAHSRAPHWYFWVNVSALCWPQASHQTCFLGWFSWGSVSPCRPGWPFVTLWSSCPSSSLLGL